MHTALLFLTLLSLSTTPADDQVGFAIDECGTIVDGVECTLFQADSDGSLYFAGNGIGSLGLGAHVRLVGFVNPACDTICQQGACVLPSSITTCEGGVPFCFGDGGDQLGCTDCPCGNNAPAGSAGGCLNANGTGASLSSAGHPGLLVDTLELDVSGANPGTFAVLASADNALPQSPMNPCPAGSGIQSTLLDGLRCIGGNLLRHGVRATDASGDIGLTNAGWGGDDAPAAGLANGFVFGQTRHFEVFYREDANVSCGTGQNTTNGVSVVIGL